MTATYFLSVLERDVPETQALVAQHFDDYDGLLLHLLVADLRRFAIQFFEAGQSDVLERLLAVLEVALRDGSDDVENAVAVSFVEDAGWWDPAMQPFIEAWPPGLRAEADRQRDYRE